MSSYFWKILNIQTEANWFVKHLFFHFFFQGSAWATLYIVAIALFLNNVSFDQIAVAYLISAAFLLLSGRVFAYLEYYLSLKNLLKSILVFMSFLLAGLFLLFDLQGQVWFGFLIFVVARLMYLLKGLGSWKLSSHLFDIRYDPKKLEWLTTGDLPGRLFGYLVSFALLYLVGLKTLLAISVVSILISLWFLGKIMKHPEFRADANKGHSDRISFKQEARDLKRFFSNRYIIPLIVLAFFVTAASVLIDFAFLGSIQVTYLDGLSIAHFLALFFSLASAVMVMTRFFALVNKITALGVKRKLLVLPLFLLVLMGILFFNGGQGTYQNFGWLTLVVLVLIALRYTFHDPLFLALLQPLVQNLKFRGYTIMYGLVAPLSMGFAGAFLVMLNPQTPFGEGNTLLFSILCLVVGWLMVILTSRNNFLKILQNAVDVRTLKGSQIAVRDKHILEILEKKLTSHHSEEVIYSIELLHRFDTAHLHERLQQLLLHPSDEVKIHSVNKVLELRLHQLSTPVKALLHDAHSSPLVKEAAIKALCSLSEEVVPEVRQLLEMGTQEVLKGAIIGLARHSDPAVSQAARQKLANLIGSPVNKNKILAAGIMGELGEEQYFEDIKVLLEDADPNVVQAAIVAAGNIGDPYFMADLMARIRSGNLYHEAMRAVEKIGEPAIPIINDEFGKANDSKERYLIRLCQLCGNIGGEEATNLLWWMLKYPWVELQVEAYNALKVLGYYADSKEKIYKVTERLETVFHQAFWFYSAISLLEKVGHFELLLNALELQLNAERRKAQMLLGFLYAEDEENYQLISQGLISVDKEERMCAQELLNEKMPGSTSEKLMVLLGNLSQKKKVELLSRFYSNKLMDHITVVMTILQDSHRENYFSRWTQATALYSLQTSFYPSMLQSFRPYLNCRDNLLCQSALHTILQFSKDRLYSLHELLGEVLNENHLEEAMKKVALQAQSLLEIEKVIILKSTSLFAETPENVLTDIAAIVKEERVNAGEVIFRKGDIGNCMYIIYEGEVMIHIGDYRLNTLINRDFFGDLGLLDTNPRSASATAERDTLLLRLDQDAFYDLMSQRPEVAKGIVQVLCARIRVQDALIMDLQGKKNVDAAQAG